MIEKYERFARKIAVNNIHKQYNHVSLLIYNSKILSVGVNKFKSHPLSFKYNYKNRGSTIHSEMDALLNLHYEHRNLKLVLLNYRFDKALNTMLSKPCVMCATWVYDYFYKVDWSV